MLLEKKLIVVMPSYNAEKTLRQTYDELPHEYIDEVILVDDASEDNTSEIANALGIKNIVHKKNRGYGANQKTCYRMALNAGADIVVMVHPDYQYSPRLVSALGSMIVSGHYDIVLGSRILGGGALKGGMPFYKYISNRFLTFIENLILKVKLSEYHTGFRAFSRQVLETLPLEENSDDFIFDNEMLVQAVIFGFKIGEISCPARYFEDASSINFGRSMKYGFGILLTLLKYIIHTLGIKEFMLFSNKGRKIAKSENKTIS